MINYFLISILILLLFALPVYSQGKQKEKNFNPFPENTGSKYEYSQDNLPEICFFPKDKARWNGYKITNKNWNKLTDYQKVCFVSEGINEIERKENIKIDYKGDALRYVNALDGGVAEMKKKMPNSEVLMIRMLIGALGLEKKK